MSFLGIDVGTSACKVSVFSEDGAPIAAASRSYEGGVLGIGKTEVASQALWDRIRDAIREVAAGTRSDPVQALAVSSMGEAVVPVSRQRTILGSSLLMSDSHGAEYLADLARRLPDERLHAINGNTLGNHYTLTKLLWLRDHRSELFDRTDLFLHWSGFVSFLLGAEPHVDRSLANRTLLFDIEAAQWSEELLRWSGMDSAKLPSVVPTGSVVGRVPASIAGDLGLPTNVTIVAGAHDQCASAVGCGAIAEGSMMCGMGTYFCLVPVYSVAQSQLLLELGLNKEHHAAPGRFVSFLYTQGGSVVGWYRDTFAPGTPYDQLFAEIPPGPGDLLALPSFAATPAHRFLEEPSGMIAGLHLMTDRARILKAILEGIGFSLLGTVDRLSEAGIRASNLRATGGGSRSDVWLQLVADLFGRPVARPRVTEAGSLGAAILAAFGSGVFGSLSEACGAMIGNGATFEPDAARHQAYGERFARWQCITAAVRSAFESAQAGNGKAPW